MTESGIFRTEEHYDAYVELADDLAEVYQDAVSLRNTFAETTRTATLRRDGTALTDQLNEVSDNALGILEQIAEETPAVETEYMVNEGWELSYHDPEDLPDDLVFACRVTECILYARGEIDWMFDDIGPGISDDKDIPGAADRVANRFPPIAAHFETVGISIEGVTASETPM